MLLRKSLLLKHCVYLLWSRGNRCPRGREACWADASGLTVIVQFWCLDVFFSMCLFPPTRIKLCPLRLLFLPRIPHPNAPQYRIYIFIYTSELHQNWVKDLAIQLRQNRYKFSPDHGSATISSPSFFLKKVSPSPIFFEKSFHSLSIYTTPILPRQIVSPKLLSGTIY